MKKILLLTILGLSIPAFGIPHAFNALCTGMRYLGASCVPLIKTIGQAKQSLTAFEKESFGIEGTLDEATNTWTERLVSEPKNYQIVTIAGKEVPVEKTYFLGPAACNDHTLSYLLGHSEYPYSVITPDIWPIHRLTNDDPNDRGITVSEYRAHLEEYVAKNTIKDHDGVLQLLAEFIKSATKEEIAAVLQHENGHGKRSAGVRIAISSALIGASLFGIDLVIMKKMGDSIASLNGPMLQMATICTVSALLGIAYYHLSSALYHAVLRHEEYKADDAIQKEQIAGQISFLQKNQITQEITERELKKNGIADDSGLVKKILNPTFETHPTDAQRIARLQKRFET